MRCLAIILKAALCILCLAVLPLLLLSDILNIAARLMCGAARHRKNAVAGALSGSLLLGAAMLVAGIFVAIDFKMR